MNKAAFSLDSYRFEKVNIDFAKKTSKELEIGFNPSGRFLKDSSSFELNFAFIAHSGNINDVFVAIECMATFKFDSEITFEEIPTYFYRNSIAIIFPYVRAFISTVTLQANIPPIVLPTLNLSTLEKPLRDNTIEI